ncbi:hypothetical protein [Candidatus Berkiella aquae]|uniref:Uncharacterized protein n=1 Tax=Candidatus Berkiella aquae TaxID=295108 RepID=A0A0Q9YLW0_9GAMM|nr:hypothetical protein [Candidatus Berkiella aquae]MCS5710622.1 hypothetical protein [Candidatus Berkiella aquae]
MLSQTLLRILGEESAPPSPTIDTRRVRLPSDWSGRYSPGIRTFLPSFKAPTGFITLKKAFHKELQVESICPKHYLNTVEREKFRIFNRDGLFYNNEGIKLNGLFLYVFFPDNRLYGGTTKDVMHHSYLSRGIDLKAAGMAYFINGRLITLSNESGHYKPTFAEMQDAIKWFLKQTNAQSFVFEDHSEQKPTEEFNGIHFYDVQPNDGGTISINYIENSQLPIVLSKLWNSVFADFSYSSWQDTEMADGYIDETGDDVYLSAEQDVKIKILSHSTELSILDFPALQGLTCLRSIGTKLPISRFNCTSKSTLRRTM